MIENKHQYNITKQKYNEFEDALEELRAKESNDEFTLLMMLSICSTKETLLEEIEEYEAKFKRNNDNENHIH